MQSGLTKKDSVIENERKLAQEGVGATYNISDNDFKHDEKIILLLQIQPYSSECGLFVASCLINNYIYNYFKMLQKFT